MKKITQLINSFIYVSYLAVVIITPLIFTTITTEIYEVPKMFFVYFASVIILFSTLLKFTLEKKITLPLNLPTIAFAIFLLTQIASTATSTDTHTSIFGYPTRLSGGIISTFAYFILFTGAFINLNAEKVKNILLALIMTAVAVSVWGIPSHFDRDPTCYILTGELTSSCWQKEFNPTLRIFSTFGQPNWLASYMVLSLPVSIALALTFQKRARLVMATAAILIFWSLILTNSRSGLLGMAFSLIILATLLGTKNLKQNLKLLMVLLVTFVIISFSFADTIKSRIADTLRNSAPQVNQAENIPSTQSSLTSGGTESGQIRLIVWQGAISIFKKWPVLGSGPETFVSSYYLFRPSAQNQTSEWEFFYNKAHNEFLNYLSTSGIIGFLGYSFFSLAIIFSISGFRREDPLASNFQKGVFAATIGYLLTIFFGFSTVTNQTTFLMLVAFALILSSKTKVRAMNLAYLNKSPVKTAQSLLLIIIFAYSLTIVGRIYLADNLNNRAQNLQGSKALLVLRNAITVSPTQNPYLLADFAYSTAAYANTQKDVANKETLTREVTTTAAKVLQLAPNNYLTTQKIAKSYILTIKDQEAAREAQHLTSKLVELAPTYPPAYLVSAQIYAALGDEDQARQFAQKSLELKSDYLEAQKLYEQLVTRD